MPRAYCVYLMASGRHGTLYIGATSDLVKRVHQHRVGAVEGFTCRYRIDRLVWFERHESAYAMVTRERQIKQWKRAWKVEMIEAGNPEWRDLYDEILGAAGGGSRLSPG